MRKYSLATFVLVIGTVTLAFLSPVRATEFYRGKSIEFLTHAPPGGLYDLHARLLARHMGRHIPGNPTIVVQNITGGGGLIQANHLFHRGKRDGTTIGILTAGVIQLEALGMAAVKYQSRKFEWIGLVSHSPAVLASHRDAPIRNLEQLLDPKREPLITGATAPPSIIYFAPAALNLVFEKTVGRPLVKIISGYGGGPALSTALERREIDGYVVSWDNITASTPHFLEPAPGKGLINLIGYMGLIKDPELEDLQVPLISDRIKNTKDRAILDFLVAPTRTLGPVTAPPGVPGEKLQILREAFMKTVSDPVYRAAVQKAKLTANASSAEELNNIVKSILETPPEIIKIAAEISKK